VKSLWKWFIGVATAIVAALFFFKKSKTTPKQEAPPSHEVTEVFVNQINEDLKEDLSKVDKATKGSSPAKDLANLGNTRSRR
tara:strand:- start:1291 stop:1536 length:246 start_codon:yes stop_codon:yes gene_type:complete